MLMVVGLSSVFLVLLLALEAFGWEKAGLWSPLQLAA